MFLSIVCILAVVLLEPCLCQEQPTRIWRVTRYPDPITNPQACGRENPSFVCDPNNLLPIETAIEIDALLKGVYNETKVPCYGTQGGRRKGYMPMVAAVPKMEKYHTANSSDTIRTRYREAQFFAYHLGESQLWGKHSSQCDEMVLILYSAEDGVLYTMTQPKARSILTDEFIQETLLDVLTIFYPFTASNRRAANALKYMVDVYSTKLREDIAA